MSKAIKRHINIPIFIPHLGCPNDCVFCNQKKISGKTSFDIKKAEKEIASYVATVEALRANGQQVESQVAFFGGSFTGIGRDEMISLLELAQGYVERGYVSSIRLSTRPDYISREILDILISYSVKNIELGVQSMSDRVLSACKRGHSSVHTEKAFSLIKKYGFSLTAQMMIGLPASTPNDEINTAKKVIEMGADSARIYPTVVLKETELADMTQRNDYCPLSKDDAVTRTADVLYEFIKADVPVIRIGLCAQDNLSTERDLYCDGYDEAIGEYAISRVYERLICEKLSAFTKGDLEGKELVVFASEGCTSKIVGHKATTKKNIISAYSLKSLKVIEKSDILGYNINIAIN